MRMRGTATRPRASDGPLLSRTAVQHPSHGIRNWEGRVLRWTGRVPVRMRLYLWGRSTRVSGLNDRTTGPIFALGSWRPVRTSLGE